VPWEWVETDRRGGKSIGGDSLLDPLRKGCLDTGDETSKNLLPDPRQRDPMRLGGRQTLQAFEEEGAGELKYM